MFESLSYLLLQQYWWVIVSLIGAVLVFLLFVQGGQTLIYTLGKNEIEKTLIVNSLGRKWEFTFTTLVVFGGGLFASFPLFYSTSFGGAYWLWMTILFCFVIQAISYEFRSKPNNFWGKKTYDTFLFINGAFGTILLGIAVATFFTGGNFVINLSNIADEQSNTISQWTNTFHGLEALANWQNWLLGFTIFFLARTLAILYFMNNISHEPLNARLVKQLWFNAIPFVLLFLAFVITIFISNGYGYDPSSLLVYIEKYKYFTNFINMPLVGLFFIVGVALTLFGITIGLFKASSKGIWYAGIGVILVVFSLFLNLGFNNTCFYPSRVDLQSSIHIRNASSSYYTLTVMSYVSILVPFVAAYMYWAWKSINNKKLSSDELNEEGHIY